MRTSVFFATVIDSRSAAAKSGALHTAVCRLSSFLPFPGHLQKQIVSCFHFGKAVSAEFIDQRRGNFKGHHILDNHASRRNRAHVASFVTGAFGLFGI